MKLGEGLIFSVMNNTKASYETWDTHSRNGPMRHSQKLELFILRSKSCSWHIIVGRVVTGYSMSGRSRAVSLKTLKGGASQQGILQPIVKCKLRYFWFMKINFCHWIWKARHCQNVCVLQSSSKKLRKYGFFNFIHTMVSLLFMQVRKVW